jgi:hypothetical protein
MPNYAPTNLAKAQGKFLNSFNSAEKRYTTPAVFNLYKSQTPYFLGNMDEMRLREDRTVELSYFKRNTLATTTGRTHDPIYSGGDTGIITPAWNQFVTGFSISLKKMDTNVYSQEEAMQNEFENSMLNLVKGIEASATTHLFTNRSGVNTSGAIEGTFDAVNDVFEVTASTSSTRFPQIIRTNMELNGYSGEIDLVCDTVAYNLITYNNFQGQGNNMNLAFQGIGINVIHATGLYAKATTLDPTYTKGFCVAVQKGFIGVTDWIPKQNRLGAGSTTATGIYTNVINPILGIKTAAFIKEVGFDGTATNGYTQDMLTTYELSHDISFSTAPLSTATESAIQAYALI